MKRKLEGVSDIPASEIGAVKLAVASKRKKLAEDVAASVEADNARLEV